MEKYFCSYTSHEYGEITLDEVHSSSKEEAAKLYISNNYNSDILKKVIVISVDELMQYVLQFKRIESWECLTI